MARAQWIMLTAQARDDVSWAHVLARAVGSPLYLDLAFGKPLRADQNLPGDADQVGACEFGAGTLISVVVEHVDALGGEFAVEFFAGPIDRRVALLQVQDGGAERRHRLRPFDAGIVMAGLDNGTGEARDTDAVGAAMDRYLRAIGPGNQRLHGVGIFGAEIED